MATMEKEQSQVTLVHTVALRCCEQMRRVCLADAQNPDYGNKLHRHGSGGIFSHNLARLWYQQSVETHWRESAGGQYKPAPMCGRQ